MPPVGTTARRRACSSGDAFLGTINGNNAFVFDGTTIKLNVAYAEEETIEVILYNGGEEWKTVTVAETPSVISGPSKSGYRFTGWALTEGGTIAFAAGMGISLYEPAGRDGGRNREAVRLL